MTRPCWPRRASRETGIATPSSACRKILIFTQPTNFGAEVVHERRPRQRVALAQAPQAPAVRRPNKGDQQLVSRGSATESMLKPSTASSVTNFWAFASTAKGERARAHLCGNQISGVPPTSSPRTRRLHGVEAHEGPRHMSNLTHWLISTRGETWTCVYDVDANRSRTKSSTLSPTRRPCSAARSRSSATDDAFRATTRVSPSALTSSSNSFRASSGSR